MSEKSLPIPVWSGAFELFGVDIKCHVLSDGQRIIEQERLEALFEAMADSESPLDDIDNLDALAISEFCKGTGIPD